MLLSTIALLLLRSNEASASDTEYRSFGRVSSCQYDSPANTTSLNMTISPDNAALTFSFSGLHTVPGNATLSIAVVADSDEVFNATLDPCSFAVPDLCPASGGVADFFNASMHISMDTMELMDLTSRADVKGRLSLNIHGTDGRMHSSCVETALRSGETSNNGNGTTVTEENGPGNGTDSSGENSTTNGTTNNDGDETSDNTQNSGANTLQIVSYAAM